MEKDTRLINIYLKIHHKRALTIEDLNYLAQYDPECFEKTCKNVVYSIPETKPIMLPEITEVSQEPEPLRKEEQETEQAVPEWQNIEKVLENLKHLEMEEFPITDIDADKVKSLLGNLYMELLFPHNDKYPFMIMTTDTTAPAFDKRA